MPSTGILRKQILHSLFERKGWLFPQQMIVYKHAIVLHVLYNEKYTEKDWIALNFQQTINQRQAKFKILRVNNWRMGNNILTNLLHTFFNNKILLADLNKTLSVYKVEYKKILLSDQFNWARACYQP